MSELTPEERAARAEELGATVPPSGATTPQPGTDDPAAPADHPTTAAPDEMAATAPAATAPAASAVDEAQRAPDPQPNTDAPAPAEQGGTATADVAPPQLGGATVANTTSLEQAQKAKADPGYVSAKPLLTTGAWGHDVAELAALLDAAGHPNPVHAGLEAPMLTDEIMRMVRAFQEANGIDPAGPQHGVTGDTAAPAAGPLVRRDHEGIVDAATWAALYDAAGVEVELAVADIRYPAGSFA